MCFDAYFEIDLLLLNTKWNEILNALDFTLNLAILEMEICIYCFLLHLLNLIINNSSLNRFECGYERNIRNICGPCCCFANISTSLLQLLDF